MSSQDPEFHTTRWSIVLSAAGPDSESRAALEELCACYWYPLYALARRKGLERSEAEDAVQEFFSELLDRDDVGKADPQRGRFRAFLVTAFRNSLANRRRHARAEKRGGQHRTLSLDQAEERYANASGRALEPEDLFDRAWALALLESALARLRGEYADRGKEELFDTLRGTLTAAPSETTRTELAEQLGLSAGALKVTLHRLRERYRKALVASVRDTVDSEDEVDAELSALFAALS